MEDDRYEDGIAPGAAWSLVCVDCGDTISGSLEDDEIEEYGHAFEYLLPEFATEVVESVFICYECIEAYAARRFKELRDS